MNIFISWSGESSRKIAGILKDWIPNVLQSAKPYYTPSDIEKGSKWESEITKKLNECTVGLICLTTDNTEKPWVLFEAGALSNKLEKSRVCPILFGLNNSDLKGPLATFQTTEFEKGDFKKLIKSINLLLEDSQISDTVLDNVFEAFYPKLQESINDVLTNSKKKEKKSNKRSDRELLEEILELSRNQYSRSEEPIKRFYEETQIRTQTIPFINDTVVFQKGDLVYHEKYGNGEVLNIDSPKNIRDTKITIKFNSGGTKKFLLRFAKLSKIES